MSGVWIRTENGPVSVLRGRDFKKSSWSRCWRGERFSRLTSAMRAIYLLSLFQFSGAVAADRGDIARDRALDDLLAVARNRAVEPGAVDDVVWVRRKQRADAFDRGRRKRNHVRVAAHEGDEFAVGYHLHDVAGQERAVAVAALRPMQHRAAGKMAAGADQRDAVGKLERIAVPEFDRRIGPHHPLAIGGMKVDRRIEGVRPFDHRRIIMRVRNSDADQSAETFDDLKGRLVEQRDAVPQHVAPGGAQQ